MKEFSYEAFKKLINHYNKSSIGVWKVFLCVLLIAQLVINLSPPEQFFIAKLIIYCERFFFRLVKSWICVFPFLNLWKKSVLIPSITILLRNTDYINFFYFVLL